MRELEGQGGRSVVQLDVHPRFTVAGREKHRGLKANERVAQHNLILAVILSFQDTKAASSLQGKAETRDPRRVERAVVDVVDIHGIYLLNM